MSTINKLHWPAFLKLFQIPRTKVHHSDRFFLAVYEYEKHFFLARPHFPKFLVKGLKITLNSCFKLVLMLKITKIFNAMHGYNSSKRINLTPIYNLELCIRKFAKTF